MMRFELRRLAEYTDDAIISEIRRVASLHDGSRLTAPDFAKHASVGKSTVVRHFGSWKKALEKANLASLYNEPGHTRRMAKQWSPNLSDKELLQELKRVANLLGSPTVTVREFNLYGAVNVGSIRIRFGSWKQAIVMAGLYLGRSGRRYTDEECFENLLAVWAHYGRAPLCREMGQLPSVVGPKAYIRRWGTWNKALHAFVERAESDDPQEKEPGTEALLAEKVPRQRADNVPDCDKHDIKLGLRYHIMVRDRFRCVLCGRSPATDLSCRLVVDHIEPFSRGGKTIPSNLRCTCQECNLGKSDSIAEGPAGQQNDRP
jgi:hypothetical protein